jgi:DNA-binding MarR family transcriptional regulator
MSFISDPLLRCSNEAHNAKAAREKAAREWIIINALEAFGPHVSLRELGRKTNINISTLNADLRRLEADGLVSKETMPLKLHSKSPWHVWSLKG